MKYIDVNKKYIILLCILFGAFAIYASCCTFSALWYDEAVEYFYSRFLYGDVPGNFGSMNTMYERICSTFQPPLYNVLMYLWLLLFDSEFGFRMAGIIVTLIGTIGIFKAVEVYSDDDYLPNIAAYIYVFTSAIVYYGLECAEYNLLLCMVCWVVFFFMRALINQDPKALIGYYVFSALAVYSQYGAAFIVLSLTMVLFVAFILKKNKRLMTFLIVGGLITFAAAIIPLLVFFTIPQITNQGTLNVSHIPCFKYKIPVDYFMGIILCLHTYFKLYSCNISGYILLVVVSVMLALILWTAIIRKSILRYLSAAIILNYTIYYIAVACSFYGYNFYVDAKGTINIAGRYSLFFLPMLVVVLVIGGSEFIQIIKHKTSGKALIIACIGLIAFWGISEIVKLYCFHWNKDDVDMLAEVWYDSKANESFTVAEKWEDAMFNYYVMNNKRFQDGDTANIKVIEDSIHVMPAEAVEKYLIDYGCLNRQDFYYVTNAFYGYEGLKEVAHKYNYSFNVIYEGVSILIYLNKEV